MKVLGIHKIDTPMIRYLSIDVTDNDIIQITNHINHTLKTHGIQKQTAKNSRHSRTLSQIVHPQCETAP